ncbi:ArsR/SmtB family transcription factor [Krasilnikovia sp. MM14-A1259]|uniref:ArsR/SmtB family transcription factor n=1 Tax=Krasilnikovia sp. MM14-A1259 TaxID=3373539 RepID=UPI00399CED74
MPDPDVFAALANPVRRQLLDALREGPRPAGELAGRFALSRPAVSEHLAVLRHAGLVREEPRGRHRFYHLAAEPLAGVRDWLHPFERYWRDRLAALRDVVEEENP